MDTTTPAIPRPRIAWRALPLLALVSLSLALPPRARAESAAERRVKKALGLRAGQALTRGGLRRGLDLRYRRQGRVVYDARGKADLRRFRENAKTRRKEEAAAASRPRQKPRLSPEEIFERLGPAQRGRVPRARLRVTSRAQRVLDPRGRGYVTLQDVRDAAALGHHASLRPKVARWMRSRDRNRDGLLDKGEITGAGWRFLLSMDRDGDERISVQELALGLTRTTRTRRGPPRKPPRAP